MFKHCAVAVYRATPRGSARRTLLSSDAAVPRAIPPGHAATPDPVPTGSGPCIRLQKLPVSPRYSNPVRSGSISSLVPPLSKPITGRHADIASSVTRPIASVREHISATSPSRNARSGSGTYPQNSTRSATASSGRPDATAIEVVLLARRAGPPTRSSRAVGCRAATSARTPGPRLAHPLLSAGSGRPAQM